MRVIRIKYLFPNFFNCELCFGDNNLIVSASVSKAVNSLFVIICFNLAACLTIFCAFRAVEGEKYVLTLSRIDFALPT